MIFLATTTSLPSTRAGTDRRGAGPIYPPGLLIARVEPGNLADMDSSDVHSRLKAAFPWFDDYRWAWGYDPDDDGAPADLIRPAPPAARGTIEIFMPTATHEQAEAVRTWLIARCRP
jgi:hypothetical protein